MSIDPNAKKYLSLKKKFSEKFKSVSTRVDPVPGPPQYSHVFKFLNGLYTILYTE